MTLTRKILEGAKSHKTGSGKTIADISTEKGEIKKGTQVDFILNRVSKKSILLKINKVELELDSEDELNDYFSNLKLN